MVEDSQELSEEVRVEGELEGNSLIEKMGHNIGSLVITNDFYILSIKCHIMVLGVNEKNFEEEITYSDMPVVVDFWAKWCAPCSAFVPTFKKLSKKYRGKIKFLKCNIQKNKALAHLFDVKSIPTLLFFCDGEIKNRLTGGYDTEKLEEELKELLKGCNP